MVNLNRPDFRISIITVSYNCKDEIIKTIESVLPHISDELEYIIIDGGSTDGTLDIIQHYATMHKIRYISEPDSGIYDAMNKGVRFAKGEWISFINCGDYLYRAPNLPSSLQSDNLMAIAYAVKSEFGIDYPIFDRRLRIHNTIPHQGLYYNRKLFPGFDTSYKIFADYALSLDFLNSNKNIETHKKLVAFHSMMGLSNNIKFKRELERVIRKKNSFIFFILSMIYFKLRGLKFRMKNLSNKIDHRKW